MQQHALLLAALLLLVRPAGAQVLLRDVQSLVFRRGHVTAASRSPPIQQIQCDGPHCSLPGAVPPTIQCTNRGLDDSGQPTWRCTGTLPSGLSFKHTEVSCEGYHHAGDPQVLQGSCGVTYSLQNDRSKYRPIHPTGFFTQPREKMESGEGPLTYLPMLVVLCFIVLVLYCVVVTPWPVPPESPYTELWEDEVPVARVAPTVRRRKRRTPTPRAFSPSPPRRRSRAVRSISEDEVLCEPIQLPPPVEEKVTYATTTTRGASPPPSAPPPEEKVTYATTTVRGGGPPSPQLTEGVPPDSPKEEEKTTFATTKSR